MRHLDASAIAAPWRVLLAGPRSGGVAGADETFCAGGTLAKYVAAGAEVMVVSVTQGEAEQNRDVHAATRRVGWRNAKGLLFFLYAVSFRQVRQWLGGSTRLLTNWPFT